MGGEPIGGRWKGMVFGPARIAPARVRRSVRRGDPVDQPEDAALAIAYAREAMRLIPRRDAVAACIVLSTAGAVVVCSGLDGGQALGPTAVAGALLAGLVAWLWLWLPLVGNVDDALRANLLLTGVDAAEAQASGERPGTEVRLAIVMFAFYDAGFGVISRLFDGDALTPGGIVVSGLGFAIVMTAVTSFESVRSARRARRAEG